MGIQNRAIFFSLSLVYAVFPAVAEEAKKTPAQEFAEIKIPLIRFSESHPIEVLNYIFSEAYKIRPDLRGVTYSFSPQPDLTSSPTPLITGGYREKTTFRAFTEMNGLCNWSFYIDGDVYRFTNSQMFYSPQYWPELSGNTKTDTGD